MGKENFISSSTDVACNFGSQPHGGICFGVKDEGALGKKRSAGTDSPEFPGILRSKQRPNHQMGGACVPDLRLPHAACEISVSSISASELWPLLVFLQSVDCLLLFCPLMSGMFPQQPHAYALDKRDCSESQGKRSSRLLD